MAINNEDLTKYEGFPFIYNIDKFVQNELSNRSFDRIRAITPFIKATPGFTLDGSESNKIVLKGIEAKSDEYQSTYEFNELYRPNSYYRPLAGIKNLSVGFLNEFGSIKKATLNWICHTLEDLERLSPYFLNPGMTMLLEWGWSNNALAALGTEHSIGNGEIINLKNCNKYIKQQRRNTNGNYDAMLGVITNYSFKLNRDGGFDCTTEVISAGYLMEGITLPQQFNKDLSVSIEQQKKDVENQKEHQNEKVQETLQNFLKTKFYAQIKEDMNKYNKVDTKDDYFILTQNDTGNGISQLVERDTAKKMETTSPDKYKSQKNTEAETETVSITLRASVYASWGYLEDKVINTHLKAKDDKGNIIFSFDSKGVKIASHKYLRTTDLGICIVPIPNSKKAAPTPNFRNNEDLQENPDFGYIRRLLINVEYFREVFLSSKTINEAVKQLFTGINNACINYWNFRLVPIEDNFDYTTDYQTEDKNGKSTTVNVESGSKSILKQKIVDINYSENLASALMNNENMYMFRTKTYSITDSNAGKIYPDVTSVVRDVSFESKLSSQAALNVFWSAHNSDGSIMGTPSSHTFQGLYDFSISSKDYSNASDTFTGKFEISNDSKNTDPNTKNDVVDPGTEIGTETDLALIGQAAYGDKLTHYLPWGSSNPNLSKGYWVRVGKINLTGIEGMKMAVLLGDDKGKPPAKSEALVPLNMSIELEGISGLRIGDVFTIDHIPTIYRKNGAFQIIGLTDNIDKSSWITTIKAGFRVYNNKKYAAIKNESQSTNASSQSYNTNVGKIDPITPPSDLIEAMKKYNITSALEKAHFLAQCSYESGGFRYKTSLIRSTGDSDKYRGRGYIQLATKKNYEAYQKYLKSQKHKEDIISNPDIVASKFPADSACYWWTQLAKLSRLANSGDSPEVVAEISKRVYGVLDQSYTSRLARFNGYWEKLKKDPNLYS